jgi:hypothetical protein
MKTADLGVLEDLLHRFDRAFHGCSQHRNRFGHRLQYCKTIDPGTQASLGGHYDMSCCDLGGGRQKRCYQWLWEEVKQKSCLGSSIMGQAPLSMSAEHRFRYLEFLPLVWSLGCSGDRTASRLEP